MDIYLVKSVEDEIKFKWYIWLCKITNEIKLIFK